jgi:hypothetical protein
MTIGSIKSGRIKSPIKALVIGDEGSGKSTLASGAPNPIFIPLDERSNDLNISRFPQPQSWDELIEAVNELDSNGHQFKTLVIDPLNWSEPLLFKKITGDPLMTASKYGGGFGKLYDEAIPHWRLLLSSLERLWRRGMNIVLIAHTTIINVNPPNEPSYNFYDVAMNRKAAGLWRQWCDYVLFLRAEQRITVDKQTKKSHNAITGLRFVYSEPCGAYAAKWTGLPPGPLPPEWSAIEDAIKAGDPSNAVGLKERITKKAFLLPAESKSTLVEYLSKAGDDVRKLVQLERAVDEKLAEVSGALPPAAEAATIPASPAPPPTPPPPAPPAPTAAQVVASVSAEAAAAIPAPVSEANKLREAISMKANEFGDVELFKKIIGYIEQAGDNVEKLGEVQAAVIAKHATIKQGILDNISALLKQLNDNATGIKVGEYIVQAKSSQKGEIVRLREIQTAVETKVKSKNGAIAQVNA